MLGRILELRCEEPESVELRLVSSAREPDESMVLEEGDGVGNSSVARSRWISGMPFYRERRLGGSENRNCCDGRGHTTRMRVFQVNGKDW